MHNTSQNPQKTPQFSHSKFSPLKVEEEHACCTGSDSRTSPEENTVLDSSDRYSWHVEGMDCAACARKVENAVKTIPDVQQVQVLFATEKLLVKSTRDIRSEVERAVTSAGYKLGDSAAPKAAPTSFWQENRTIIVLIVLMAASWGLEQANHPFGNLAFIITTLVGLGPIARQALRLIRSGSWFAIETLMSVAAIGALFIGATAEAAMVLVLFLIGERLESYAASRARRGVSALMALKPDTAIRVRDGQRETVAQKDLRPGDIIEVAAGGRLPADGRLLNAFASFDESALTGESIPVEHQKGENVSAGCTSIDRLVQMEVVSEPGDSAIDRVLRLIEEAEERRAPIERFIDRFSRVYTPLIMALALLTVIIPPLMFGQLWEPWIYKGLTLLLIGCPCALVISTPAAITSGLAAAARYGALIKGGAALERLSQIQQIAFDKTGTLTAGKPQVTTLTTAEGIDENQLLVLAAAVEQGSTHPLAVAIISAAQQRALSLPVTEQHQVLPGVGIEAMIDGQMIRLSSPTKLPAGSLNTEWQQRITQQEDEGQTVIVVLREGKLLGAIAMRDQLRSDARVAVSALNALGVKGVMLTGDNPRAAAAIASELGIDYRASLLPADKVRIVNELGQSAPLAMVGDGINDAPAMKAATMGIAMGSGTDVALETADAAITHNRLTELSRMITIARATHTTIRQNISIALGLKLVFLVTTLLGMTGLWIAVLADSGATALVTANALRLLRRK
ncbi:Zn(II)/Cd(II)/Pb(II) translocating P-type ATPase ZntA [Klebsiella sp. BIGb0407]|uniref:Zn(II)/Cd(II)/Pb(II) translocating P-type ATPase ZntA n=1 Tax=Klebsiella sp. BIGb0407 TaxID=2940603 RepID=UPI00216846ED|nr:Zn(II)/Cd(II)/Pb(II) translocating P-type ATPase ZntA [Klebsiella sp. BIGb0407]MCS3432786.1 Cd2+/Zn2+-exporting ATPase [Klebsiella sp. BIGb0407]